MVQRPCLKSLEEVGPLIFYCAQPGSARPLFFRILEGDSMGRWCEVPSQFGRRHRRLNVWRPFWEKVGQARFSGDYKVAETHRRLHQGEP